MASTDKTNLGLNQWVLSDKPSMEDFNEDNRIVDGKLVELEENHEALAEEVEELDRNLAVVDGRVSTAEGDIQSAKQSLTGVNTTLDSHNTRIGSAETRLNNVDTQLTNHQGRITTLESASGIGDEGLGKQYATFVVGTTTSGHKTGDVDYLCDGTDDQVEINAAIQALPAGGGKVIIREGRYVLTGSVLVDKDNVTLEGMGRSTVLFREFAGTAANPGLVYATGDYLTVRFLFIDGNQENYASGTRSDGIYASGANATIIGNICRNNYNGINVGSNSTITGNNCCENDHTGINAAISIIAENICSNNGFYGIVGTASTITGNTCNNNEHGISGTGSGCTVAGNTCEYNSNRGINVASQSTITGNTSNNNSHGIYVTGSNSTITGNTCSSNNSYGLSTSIYTSNLLIDGNNLFGNTTAIQNLGTNNTLGTNKTS